MSKIELVTNAFRPGSAMDDPSLFAGRREQIRGMAQALHAVGDCPIIYGHSGLGKTSLAMQAQLIATGDRELLVKSGYPDWVIDDDRSFVSVYVACSDGTPHYKEILRRLINGLLLLPQAAATGSGEASLVESATRLRFSAKVFEAEKEFRYIHDYDMSDDAPNLDYEERILELVNTISLRTGARVLLIIDELDRVSDVTGLASFIKSASSTQLKFILVGIAQNVAELLIDHQSINRLQVPIEVPLMEENELGAIIHRAMRRLADEGIGIDFSDDATKLLVAMSQGFPWFVHLLGREALLKVFTEKRSKVHEIDIEAARQELTDRRLAQQFSDTYQQAVRDSFTRELVLRTFAGWGGNDIYTTDVYRLLRHRLDVNHPEVYLGHLCQERHGQVFMRPPYQKRGMVRFCNEMFKAYVRLRPSLYAGIENQVAWAYRMRRIDFDQSSGDFERDFGDFDSSVRVEEIVLMIKDTFGVVEVPQSRPSSEGNHQMPL